MADFRLAVNKAARTGRIAPHHQYHVTFEKESAEQSGFYFYSQEISYDEINRLRKLGVRTLIHKGEIRDGDAFEDFGIHTHDPAQADTLVGLGEKLPTRYRK